MQHAQIMRTLVLMVLLAGACKGRPTDDDRSTGAKIVEAPDDDFRQTRLAFQNQARARLAQINARIREVNDDASVQLRAQRDQLAMRVEKIDEQGESNWDAFRAELNDSFDALERELGGY